MRLSWIRAWVIISRYPVSTILKVEVMRRTGLRARRQAETSAARVDLGVQAVRTSEMIRGPLGLPREGDE